MRLWFESKSWLGAAQLIREMRHAQPVRQVHDVNGIPLAISLWRGVTLLVGLVSQWAIWRRFASPQTVETSFPTDGISPFLICRSFDSSDWLVIFPLSFKFNLSCYFSPEFLGADSSMRYIESNLSRLQVIWAAYLLGLKLFKDGRVDHECRVVAHAKRQDSLGLVAEQGAGFGSRRTCDTVLAMCTCHLGNYCHFTQDILALLLWVPNEIAAVAYFVASGLKLRPFVLEALGWCGFAGRVIVLSPMSSIWARNVYLFSPFYCGRHNLGC
jgi:hypothetical protein